jgi:tyrosine-protein phosphatase SIW14
LIRRVLHLLPVIAIMASLIGVPIAYSYVREKNLGHFRVVEEGRLYRSAQLTPAGLDRVIHDHRIRTVISFRDVEAGKTVIPPDEWEELFCRKLGVNYVRMPLRHWSPIDGVPPAEENVTRFLEIMRDPKNYPVLVHCFRGVHRTGSYCAIYRMEFQGWSNQEAMEELHDLGYENLYQEEDIRTYLETYKPRRKAP